MDPKQRDNVINKLGFKRTIHFNDQVFNLACVLRDEDRRPFQAEWWKGKEAYLVAVDDNGHLYLRHCGGYIFKIDPVSKNELILAKNESEFLSMITAD